ncbi:MAG: ABC transporter permease [Planctomycetota bacterium]
MKFVLLIVKNLRRNLLRTILTAMGTIVLVFVVTLVWSILAFLDTAIADKSQNFKAIVTERWQIPSQMPFAYAATLSEGAAKNEGDIRPTDSMTWQFFGGTLDPVKRTRENLIFFFALEPKKLATMMDDLDSLTGADAEMLQEGIKKMEENRQGILVGRDRLAAINKRVGERIKLYSINYKDIDLEFEIVGTFPSGRYDQSAAMNRDYLNEALDNYARTHQGKKHPMADKTLNLVWLRVPDSTAYAKVTDQIMNSPDYASPAVKCETASSGIAAFLEAYRDLIWGMRWLLAPAILVTLSLVIANAISINVRERRLEMAVLKVLGFKPKQILLLILGEALLVGTIAGMISAAGTYLVVNDVIGGLKFPIAFFPAFFIPAAALWWGPATGALTAFAGSFVPAWTARTVKVADVFSKIA